MLERIMMDYKVMINLVIFKEVIWFLTAVCVKRIIFKLFTTKNGSNAETFVWYQNIINWT